ncbi:MAG: sigma-70 family RNA polymerase sigma factor [Actinomycetota bacterium]|nr:sigma-70 family RNA polymerase sigma factor [Actinomycetota bacterium]
MTNARDPVGGSTDIELWRRAVGGEPEAFGGLFERHARAIYNYCFRRTADWALAEDVMSTTFMHAWRRRSEVRFDGASVLPWLYGIAANLVRNLRRRADRDRSLVERVSGVEPGAADAASASASASSADPADDVAGRLDAERRMAEVLERLRALSEDDQDIFSLCVWQGLSYQETSVALGVPVGTVRSRLSRARERLRRSLSPDTGSEDPPELPRALTERKEA